MTEAIIELGKDIALGLLTLLSVSASHPCSVRECSKLGHIQRGTKMQTLESIFRELP